MRGRTVTLGALALIGGGIAWAVVWFMVAFTDDGARRVLGVSEGGWRALLNPALVALIVGVVVFAMRLASRAGGLGFLSLVVVELGLATMLVGNVAEVGLAGDGFTDSGWGVFLAGAGGAVVGLLLMGVAIVRTGLLPRTASLPFAGGLAAFAAGAMFAPLAGVGWLLWGYVLLAAREVRPAPTDEEVRA